MRRILTRARASICARSFDKGQAVTEYVLLLLGLVTLLVVVAAAMTSPISNAVNQIVNWTASIQPPSPGQQGHRGGGEDNSNNQGNHNGDNVNGH